MRNFSDQTELAAYVRERLTSQIERARSLVDGVDENTLTQPRSGGAWSPAAVLEHLSVINRLYLPKIEAAVASATPSLHRDWTPTVAGRLLRWSVTTSMKLKTPSLFKPEDPRSDTKALNRFQRSQEEVLRALERSAARHWKSVRLSSPASNLVKLNLGDIFAVLADHGDRHLNQIEALLAQASKPSED